MLQGEFTSIHGVQWKVQIVGTDLEGTLVFPIDPLTIEWEGKSKEDVICGSTATLKIESQSDRQFLSLYSETVGSIRLDVYRNDSLWWSGCLDPEFYEEPYWRNKYYDVTLTFTDFGQLNRLAYNMTGSQTMALVYWDAINRLGLNDSIETDQTYVSTYNGTDKISLATLMVDSANFYDEESEPSKLDDVIEAMFQPLGLKMIQKNGKIYIFDLNGIASTLPQTEIYWDGVDSVLGVDKVYNNIKVTFSPYYLNAVFDGDMGVTDVDTSHLGDEGDTYHTYYKGYGDDYSEKKEGDKDFTLFTDITLGDNYTEGEAPAVAIRKIYGGEDSDCFAALYCVGQDSLDSGNVTKNLECGFENTQFTPLVCKTKKMLVSANANCYMRLEQEMFLDVRYNPWREGSDSNEKDNYKTASTDGLISRVMTPFRMRLYDENNNILYHYQNDEYFQTTDKEASLGYKGKWVAGDYDLTGNPYGASGTDVYAYLMWYDPSTFTVNQMKGSWISNYQTMGYPTVSADPLVASAPSGQYIPYPPVGGYIEIELYANIAIAALASGYNENWWQGHYDMFRWVLFKAPQLKLVETVSPFNEISGEDIEYSGILDENAADDLSIDVNCGTSANDLPCARGSIMDVDGNQIHSLTRNGVTDVAEHLLIGTMFSAYGKRHAKLSGTARIEPDFKVFTDANTTEMFMCVGEELSIREDTTNITLVELNTDSYHGVTK